MTTWHPRRPITQQILPCDRYDWLRDGGTKRFAAIPSSRIRRWIRVAAWVVGVVAAVSLVVAIGRRFG